MSDLCEFVREKLDDYGKERMLNALAGRSGVDFKSLSRIRKGSEAQVGTIEKILDAMGYEIVVRRQSGI